MRLTLFFTRGVSLRIWREAGILDRELALYRRLMDRGVLVDFITWGDAGDLEYGEVLGGIRIFCNRWRLRRGLYERLIPWLHFRALRSADVVKSNQMDGADAALEAARFWGKPLVARCGYMASDFAAREQGVDAPETRRLLNLESTVFEAADRVVVSTQAMADEVAARIPKAGGKLAVHPNFVDTELFKPDAGAKPDVDVLFIGRFHAQKNVENLLEALARTRVSARLIGEGPLKETLRGKYGDLDGRLAWDNRVDHASLPALINGARLFVFPSNYEGHPKVLLEAMACGGAVIGGDSPGVREEIDHGVNGWLCGLAPDAIAEAIQNLLGKDEERKKLGEAARDYVAARYSLDTIAQKELALFQEMTG